MQRFDSGVKWLRRKGLKPSQASMLCAVMNILGEASRQQKYLPGWDDRRDGLQSNLLQLSSAEETHSSSGN